MFRAKVTPPFQGEWILSDGGFQREAAQISETYVTLHGYVLCYVRAVCINSFCEGDRLRLKKQLRAKLKIMIGYNRHIDCKKLSLRYLDDVR